MSGKLFSAWQGDALVSGLGSKAIVRIAIDDERAEEVERFDMGARIRSALEGLNGAWVRRTNGSSKGRLLRLTPR